MNLQATINEEFDEWQYWVNIYQKVAWKEVGKTREDVVALMNYFEGRYDMACVLRQVGCDNEN